MNANNCVKIEILISLLIRIDLNIKGILPPKILP